MNKLTTIIASTAIAMLSFASTANSIEYKVGLTGQATAVYGSAEEQLKDAGRKTQDTALGAFSYMSGFAEVSLESAMGLTLGLEYTPDLMEFPTADRIIRTSAFDVGGANANVTGEDNAGTQTMKASVEEMVTVYVAMPLMDTGLHVKLGYSEATLLTEESLSTGSSYGNVDLHSMSAGMYYDGDLGDMAFYRLEGSYTAYDDIIATGSEVGSDGASYNKIKAELGGVAAKLSLGLRF
jgi:hypothetical protein